MKKTRMFLLIAGLVCLLISAIGCSSEKVEVIDLDKVLDILVATMDDMKNQPVEDYNPGDGQQPVAVDPANLDPEPIVDYLTEAQKRLNDANLMSTPIALSMQRDGAILGVTDANKNGLNDAGETQLFKVELDSQRSRLIATDTQNNYHRDHEYHYRPGMGSGLFMGYMLGSMMGGQRYYGYSPSRYSNYKMNRRGYHKSAVTAVKKARSRSGSRSFRGGK